MRTTVSDVPQLFKTIEVAEAFNAAKPFNGRMAQMEYPPRLKSVEALRNDDPRKPSYSLPGYPAQQLGEMGHKLSE